MFGFFLHVYSDLAVIKIWASERGHGPRIFGWIAILDKHWEWKWNMDFKVVVERGKSDTKL